MHAIPRTSFILQDWNSVHREQRPTPRPPQQPPSYFPSSPGALCAWSPTYVVVGCSWWLISRNATSSEFILRQHVWESPSFLRLNNVPPHGWTTSGLSILLRRAAWVAPSFWLKNAAVNTGLQISVRGPAFNSLGCISRKYFYFNSHFLNSYPNVNSSSCSLRIMRKTKVPAAWGARELWNFSAFHSTLGIWAAALESRLGSDERKGGSLICCFQRNLSSAPGLLLGVVSEECVPRKGKDWEGL